MLYQYVSLTITLTPHPLTNTPHPHTNTPTCIQTLDSDLKECGVKLSTVVAEKAQLEEELKELVKTRAKMEMDMRDMEKRVAEDSSTTVRGGAGVGHWNAGGRECLPVACLCNVKCYHVAMATLYCCVVCSQVVVRSWWLWRSRSALRQLS